MKYLLIFLYVFITSTNLSGKEIFMLRGFVNDKDSNPIERASVRVLSIDSIFLSGATTNVRGLFTLKVSQKQCIVEVSCLGYQKYYKSIFIDKSNEECFLDTIKLQSESVNLSEVTITAKATAMQMRGDTLEYNTCIYTLPKQASVRDLLKLLPNLTVTDKGQIFVQGEEVDRIHIDGKEFFSTDPGMASKSLPALIVDKVQVVEQSSEADRLTGFDSEKKETILNLVVKKENKIGLMTQATVGGGYGLDEDKMRYDQNGYINILKKQDIFNISLDNNNTNTGAGSSLNGENSISKIGFTINKDFNKYINISSNVMYNSMNTIENIVSERQTFLSPESFLYDKSDNLSKSKSKYLSFDTKTKWNPNDKNTLIVQASMNYMLKHNDDNELFSSINDIRDTLYSGNSTRWSKGDNYFLDIILDYAYRLKKKGRVLSTSLQGTIGSGDSHGIHAWNRKLYDGNIFMRDSLVNQHTTNLNANKLFNLTLSYVEPIKENQFIQLVYTVRSIDNTTNERTYNHSSDILSDNFSLLPDQSPNTRQISLNQRFAMNYKYVGVKTDFIMGINVDIDDSDNETFLSGDSLKSNVKTQITNYSPILNIKYRFNKSNILSFDYVGTMTSPSPLQLRDYTNISNPTNSIKGNPELKPQFSNGSSLKFTGSNPNTQSYFNASLSGQFIMNAIQSSVSINPTDGYRITTYRNTENNWNIHFQSSYYTPIKGTHFTLGNTISSGYDKKTGLINDETSTMESFIFDEQPHISYFTMDFEYRIQGLFKYMGIRRQNVANSNMRTIDWGASVSVSYLLPYKIRFASSFSWCLKKGYGNFGNVKEKNLDVALTKDCFSKKYGTLSIQLSIFDLLQNRNQLSRNIGTSYVQNTMASTIGRYFMCSLIYSFNAFPSE